MLLAVETIAGDEAAGPAGEAIEFACRRRGAVAGERKQMVWLRERKVSGLGRESTSLLRMEVAAKGAPC